MKLLLSSIILLTTFAAQAQEQVFEKELAQLEQQKQCRIGIAAINVATNQRCQYHADERFLMCSTFKLLAVAAALHRVDENKEKLNRFVKYGEEQLLAYAPVTRAHVGEGGMTLEALCAAAIEQSDNTAGNLILEAIGGLKGFNEFVRALGDKFTHLDRMEPDLNVAVPGQDMDSTTSAAMCADLQHLFASDFLTQGSRARLESWMQANETGLNLIRAATPTNWKVGDKTGRSGAGATNDIAILRPPTGGPFFIAIYTDNPGETAEARDSLVAEITKAALSQFTSGATNETSKSPCAAALASGTVCEAAQKRALELLRLSHLEAVTVMHQVQTGKLVLAVSSNPAKFDSGSSLLPLSPIKLMVAASWYEHKASARSYLPDSDKLLTESIVNGKDDAGRRLARALRKAVGTEGVLKDLERYGFGASHSLGKETSDKDWEDTLSLGEQRCVVTALQLSQFLQAVGNDGVMLKTPGLPEKILSENAARKLQAVMRGTVEYGTAKSAAPILADTGWQMGGKTGTGPGANGTAGPESDGWFTGLIFDPQSKAQFTIATFVKHGGLGGGNAARISATLARFLIGADSGETGMVAQPIVSK